MYLFIILNNSKNLYFTSVTCSSAMVLPIYHYHAEASLLFPLYIIFGYYGITTE